MRKMRIEMLQFLFVEKQSKKIIKKNKMDKRLKWFG